MYLKSATKSLISSALCEKLCCINIHVQTLFKHAIRARNTNEQKKSTTTRDPCTIDNIPKYRWYQRSWFQ